VAKIKSLKQYKLYILLYAIRCKGFISVKTYLRPVTVKTTLKASLECKTSKSFKFKNSFFLKMFTNAHCFAIYVMHCIKSLPPVAGRVPVNHCCERRAC